MQEDTYHGDGLNLYAYVGNNPVRYVDPSGHCKDCTKDNGVSNIVYRAVTPEQAISIREGKGIVKPKPYAKTNPTQHVGGVKHKKIHGHQRQEKSLRQNFFQLMEGKIWIIQIR